MRNGKRSTLLPLLAVGIIIFFLGMFSGRSNTPDTAVAADRRTAMERYVDAFAQYTKAETDRFSQFQAAVAKADWDTFWATMVRITVATIIVVAGTFSLRLSPILLESIRKRTSVLKTARGDYLLEFVEGQLMARPVDVPFPTDVPAKRQAETLPITHNGETIEISRDGKVIDVVEDAADFLERAIKVNGPHSKEIPHHDKMGVSGEKWSSMVHQTLGGLFEVDNRGGGVKTYCTAYPDLATTYYAVKRKEVPLPEKKKAKK